MTSERRGRFIKYDKQRVLEDIVRGTKSAKKIAASHGITRDMVYSLKHAAKKRGLIKEPTQFLADLSPVDSRAFYEGPARDILEFAKQFKAGDLSELDFYQKVQQRIYA